MQQPFDNQIAYGHQHLIGLIVAVKAKIPIYRMHIQRVNFFEIEEQISQFLFSCLGNIIPQQQLHSGFENAIHIRIHRELIIGTDKLLFHECLLLN